MSEYSLYQHNVTPDRVVFAYRDGDADSLEVAQYYQSKRGIPSNHLIALPCDSSYAITADDYVTTIEQPLQAALDTLDTGISSSGQREIWVIILGYHVPVVYLEEDPYDPYDPYASTGMKAVASRLHRLGFTEQNEFPNYIYNRQVFKFFDEEDSVGLYMTAVINGPTKARAKSLIDRSIDIDNQNFVTGKVYIDPYGLNSTTAQQEYRDDILDFVTNGSSDLGLNVEITTLPLDGSDPLVAYLRQDSFYWGWYTPQYTTSLLINQNQRRVFLYNADEEGATTFTSGLDPDGSDPWCTVAINATPHYATCAGAVDAPGEEAYLRPRPFFAALHQGASVGEAFLLSSPVVDWRIILIGDPLMTVNFPSDIPNDQDPSYSLISNDEGIRLTKEYLEESLAYALRQARLATELLEFAYLRENVEEEVSLLYPINQWKNFRNESDQYNMLTSAVTGLARYVLSTTGVDFSGWLTREGEKTTYFMQQLIAAGIPTTPISSDLIHEEGSWQYEFLYIHPRQKLESVYFQFQVANDSAFSDLVVNVSSLTDLEGWKYEQEVNRFVQMVSEGFPSSFSGRRVRYEAPEDYYLTRTETYFIRYRPLDSLGAAIDGWTVDSNKMIIKR